MTDNNQIIKDLIGELSGQRDRLLREIIDINVNENNYEERRLMIEYQITQIDNNISNALMNITHGK